MEDVIRTPINKAEFLEQYTALHNQFDVKDTCTFENREFTFDLEIPSGFRALRFENCEFKKVKFLKAKVTIPENEANAVDITIEDADDLLTGYEKEIIFREHITFEKGCQFEGLLNLKYVTFEKKFRIHNSVLTEVNFSNTKFNDLADFWATFFTNKTIFKKTDFNGTAVFSMATFNEDVLFTYSLFNSKVIFNRTSFIKGLDLSQAIISGDLKPMDLKFNYEDFKTRYYGENNVDYQASIDDGKIIRNKGGDNQFEELLPIPLVDKVHTFQILKNQFEKLGNYADANTMQYHEKRSLRELNNAQLTLNPRTNWFVILKDSLRSKILNIFTIDTSWNELTSNDGFILALNRWSNDYGTNFWKGVRFTLKITAFFGFLTLIFTNAFWNTLFHPSEVNADTIASGVGFFFNFLNPARRMSDVTELEPFYGIAYFFDFLGRVLVGYGIYQTVQAFRKFK